MTRLPAGVHSLRDRSMPPPGWSAYAAASWGSTVRAWTPGLPGGRPLAFPLCFPRVSLSVSNGDIRADVLAL